MDKFGWVDVVVILIEFVHILMDLFSELFGAIQMLCELLYKLYSWPWSIDWILCLVWFCFSKWSFNMLLKASFNLLSSTDCPNSFSRMNHENYSHVPPCPPDCI